MSQRARKPKALSLKDALDTAQSVEDALSVIAQLLVDEIR